MRVALTANSCVRYAMRMLGFALITSPSSGCSCPVMICSCVVLPAPFTPAMRHNTYVCHKHRISMSTREIRELTCQQVTGEGQHAHDARPRPRDMDAYRLLQDGHRDGEQFYALRCT